MTPEQLKEIRWMRSMPLALEFDSSRIDRQNGVLHDVVMVQEGEAKGHGFYLEGEFVTDLVAYDQKNYSKRGLKNRFGHPGASDDTLGTQMGYFQNFRTRKKAGKMQAIADLHLLDAADISPTKPNMKEWMMKMAEEAPDFVMQSIVFKPGRYYQKGNDGKKKYVYEYTKVTGEDGEKYDKWVSADPSLGNVFIEFGTKGEHYYTDTVEAGAATESLFSTEANPHLFVSKALAWLEEHPELKAFAREHPQKVHAFLESLGVQVSKPKTISMSLKELLFGKDKATEEVTLTADEITELRASLDKAQTALAAAEKRAGDAEAKAKVLETAAADADTKLKAAQDRITELEAQAADNHEKPGERKLETEKPGDVKSWMRDPINTRAAGFKTGKAA